MGMLAVKKEYRKSMMKVGEGIKEQIELITDAEHLPIILCANRYFEARWFFKKWRQKLVANKAEVFESET